MRGLKAVAALVLAAVGGSGQAMADGALMPAYGGQMVETPEGLRVEFAVREGAVRAWVRDHGDKPIPASKVSGKATILAGSKKLDLPLKADGEALVAEGALAQADKVTAILSLTVDGKSVSARFAQSELVQPTTLTPPAQAGKVAFEAICATCHGKALRGTDNGPPLLHAYYAPGAGHGDDVVLATIANGTTSHHWKFGDMPKPEGLKPGQEKDVLAYVRAMQAAAAPPRSRSA
ncbi:MAG: cytochrome c [Magnetospirillum sp.]|nr:cytochrome c [Magnetospirillum sp.]